MNERRISVSEAARRLGVKEPAVRAMIDRLELRETYGPGHDRTTPLLLDEVERLRRRRVVQHGAVTRRDRQVAWIGEPCELLEALRSRGAGIRQPRLLHVVEAANLLDAIDQHEAGDRPIVIVDERRYQIEQMLFQSLKHRMSTLVLDVDAHVRDVHAWCWQQIEYRSSRWRP